MDRDDLSEGAKVCDCGGELHPIGVERSQAIERLELCYVQVDEFVKFACRFCERIHVADHGSRMLCDLLEKVPWSVEPGLEGLVVLSVGWGMVKMVGLGILSFGDSPSREVLWFVILKVC